MIGGFRRDLGYAARALRYGLNFFGYGHKRTTARAQNG
jgi:hypothetical protein